MGKKGCKKVIKGCKERVSKDFFISGYMDDALVSTIDNIAETVNKFIAKGGRILDFGAGPCDKTAVISCMGYECYAYDDLGDDWVKQNGYIDKIRMFASRYDIKLSIAHEGYLPFNNNTFDMVMSHDVLEHLHDSPREVFNDLVELIKPGGYLFVTVPNAVNVRKRIRVLLGKTNMADFGSYYWYPDPWRGHVREYVRNDLELFSSYLGLEIVCLRGCDHMLHRVPRELRWGYKALTRWLDGWKDSWMLVAKKPKDWKSKRNLSKEEFYLTQAKTSPFYSRKLS